MGAQLRNMLGVSGIPSLVIVDPEGMQFPWYPKPVTDLKSGPGSLQEVPSVIAFCESSTPEVQKAVADAMMPLAQRYLDMQKKESENNPKYAFMIASEAGGIAARLREVMSIPLSTQSP